MADPPEAQAVDSSAFLHIASPHLPTGNSNPSQTHAQDAIRASSSEFSCRSAPATSPPNLVRITMREISPKMATKPRSSTGCVLPRVGLRAVEDKSPGRLCPSIAFTLHIPPLAPRYVPERGFVSIFGRFCRTTSSNRRQTARRSRRKKGRAPTKKEGRTIRPRPTQAQKDCDTPSRSAAAWDDQTPSHPNTEGPGSYSLPPLSASFAASPSTSPKPSLKLLGTTTVPPVSRTLSYSRCMARKRSAASFLA